jgi:CRP-like cAMP-binding protein
MTIGNDGFAGTAIFHEKSSAHCLAVCQITGTLRRLSVTEFRHLIHTTPTLARLLHIYSQFVFEVVSQAAACNRMHHIDQRAARWLLMSADRVGRPRFDLTQEFFAEMLGVRRPGVTQTIGVLTSRNLITHGRGWIAIEDRLGLEAVSCECYEVINRMQRSAFS